MESWIETERKRRTAKRLRVVWIVVAVVVAGLVAGTLRTRGDAEQAEAAPGFRDPTRSVDTSPFELPVPENSSGLTTLIYPSTSIPPSETTTTQPPPPPDPDPVQLQIEAPPANGGICGLYLMVRSFQTLNTLDQAQLRATLTTASPVHADLSVADDVRGLLTQYEAAAPASMRDAVATIAATYAEMFDVVERNDYDLARPELADLVQDLVAGTGRHRSFIDAVVLVGQYTHEVCD